jgi:hypothetical protein
MMCVWMLSKAYQAPGGEILPVAWSYGYNHSAMGYQANGWGLTCVSMDAHQLVFVRSGVDANIQYVGIAGKETWVKPTALLLETYKELLGDVTYDHLGHVLDKLGETEPRFLLERDPHRP